MCGFVGIIGQDLPQHQAARSQTIERMSNAIAHRGPDDSGEFLDDNIALGFRRLSIIDLEHGHQPLKSNDESKVICFNGEIYNYQILRNELKGYGYQFRTQSDTEVLLTAYDNWGQDLLHHLRGMFAFCIWDATKQTAFIARDFFGIKPLYYCQTGQDGNVLVVTSEIKAILQHPAYQKALNLEALQNYLSFQFSPGAETFFAGIKKLEGGCAMSWQQGQVKQWRYFDPLPVNPDQSAQATNGRPYVKNTLANTVQPSVVGASSARLNPENGLLSNYTEAVELISDTIKDSVKAHMIADVEVGSLLSSGIDSSYITALYPNQKTYTVGFKTADGAKYNEIAFAKQTAQLLKKQNTSQEIAPSDFWDSIPAVMQAMDEPLADASAVALYFLDKMVAQDVKVVLSGEGADEFFGGYQCYHEPLSLNGFQRALPAGLRRGLSALANAVPFHFKGQSFLTRAALDITERYIGNAYIFRSDEIKLFYKQYNSALSPQLLTAPYYASSAYADDTARMQYIDDNFWLPGDILLKADKMSMAHSLESRVPFLDIEVFKLANRLPLEFKIDGATTKKALRQAAMRMLPPEVAHKPKLGFPVPLRVWLRQDDYVSRVQDCFTSATAAEYFDSSYLLELLNSHKSGLADYSRQIWTVYCFLQWHTVYF